MFRDLMFLLAAAACLAAGIASPADSKPHKDNTTDIVTWPQLENELLIKKHFYKEYYTKMLDLIEKSEGLDEIDVDPTKAPEDSWRRVKRANEQHVGQNWCCKQDAQTASEGRQVIKSRAVQKTLTSGGSRKCGFLGLSRCGSESQRVVTVTEYYIDTEYVDIPAPEWINGCPRDQIVCCNGYILLKPIGNCMTLDDVTSTLSIAEKYQDALSFLDKING